MHSFVVSKEAKVKDPLMSFKCLAWSEETLYKQNLDDYFGTLVFILVLIVNINKGGIKATCSLP